MKYKVKIFHDDKGKEPFSLWLKKLDRNIVKRIFLSINTVSVGNFSNCKNLKYGIFELKLYFGAGLRVYFGKHEHEIILLLLGRDKSTQRKDIEKAKMYWTDFLILENEVMKNDK
ncbi:MAG: type II toxin-antitoxin system RelE/ParE family toxin [Bacteroidetes bacterium]|nr:type II toxin-antitoxin system RelE/ParE family toxin [Bacteroidota bacterium]